MLRTLHHLAVYRQHLIYDTEQSVESWLDCIAPIDCAGADDLSFVADAKYALALPSTKAGAVLTCDRFACHALVADIGDAGDRRRVLEHCLAVGHEPDVLINAAGIEKAMAKIAGALPRAVKIVSVADGKVDTAALLGLGVGTEDDIANRRTRHDLEEAHDHDDFDSFVVTLPEIADPNAFAARVAAIAEAASVLRVKGFAAVAGKPMRLLLQAVGPRVTHQYDRPWQPGEARASRLVVIGLKGIDRAAITRALVS